MKGMIGVEQLAEWIGVSRPTLRRWLADGKLPPPHAVLGQTKLWNERWLVRWLSEQQRRVRDAERASEMAKVKAEQAEFERTSPLLAAQLRRCR